MAGGLAETWPFAAELFDGDARVDRLVAQGLAADPAGLRQGWLGFVTDTLGQATLTVPVAPRAPGGGRRGIHTECFGHMLAEMQYLHRSHPGARW